MKDEIVNFYQRLNMETDNWKPNLRMENINI